MPQLQSPQPGLAWAESLLTRTPQHPTGRGSPDPHPPQPHLPQPSPQRLRGEGFSGGGKGAEKKGGILGALTPSLALIFHGAPAVGGELHPDRTKPHPSQPLVLPAAHCRLAPHSQAPSRPSQFWGGQPRPGSPVRPSELSQVDVGSLEGREGVDRVPWASPDLLESPSPGWPLPQSPCQSVPTLFL